MIEAIREWWYRRQMLKLKRRALFEVRQDKRFLKTKYGELLVKTTNVLRAELAEKRKADKQDVEAIGALEGKIADIEAAKKTFGQLVDLERDCMDYISQLLLP